MPLIQISLLGNDKKPKREEFVDLIIIAYGK